MTIHQENAGKYLAAVKTVQTKKPKDNYMVVQLGYNTRLILPHSAGVALLTALANAEQIEDMHSSRPKISEYDGSAVSVALMSSEEYERIKIARLLNVTVDDVKEYALSTQ